MKKIYAILLAIFLLTGVCPIPLYAARTVTASANTENDTDIFDLTDGEYAIDVTMTGGSGTYSYEFARYEQAPSDVQEKEVASRAAEV